MIDLNAFIGPSANIILVGIIGYFVKSELHEIKERLARIEAIYFHKGM